MPTREAHTLIRGEARAFEESLPLSQRKELGQFFTGMSLGRILAHLAVDGDTRRIVDPMAGSGDLLDAAYEATAAHGAAPERFDGIEIDEAAAAMCARRLRRICGDRYAVPHVICADAFGPATYDTLPENGYDLVITNPPYVRYQALNGRAEQVRRGLSTIASRRSCDATRNVWSALIDGYSGLADLSVPAWLLSALLVKPSGRLALVVPATWRSRAYADVIRYLLLRCFRLELIVEDTQPGWFSDALVRTHLVIGRRLDEDQLAKPLAARAEFTPARWIQVTHDAASSTSLVGRAFGSEQPEAEFAMWACAEEQPELPGISCRSFSREEEWYALRAQAGERAWFKALEQTAPEFLSFASAHATATPVPEALKDLLPASFDRRTLRALDDAKIRVGQGLRTGCNKFFYVRLLEQPVEDGAIVATDSALGGRELSVPASVLRPVLHRQADLEAWRKGTVPATRVLDLRCLVLSEDMDTVHAATKLYRVKSTCLPQIMPDGLATHVREAADTVTGKGANVVPVSRLSAVKTNIRPARAGGLPRFWYMLPDFMPRHMPQAFVPRIIHTQPCVYENPEPRALIDANFSTFWTERANWTATGLTAFLNSSWCRTVFEAAGTSLGGGALKLEAVHLRKMPVPHFGPETIASLNAAAASAPESRNEREIDRIVLRPLFAGALSDTEIDTFSERLNERCAALGAARRRSTT